MHYRPQEYQHKINNNHKPRQRIQQWENHFLGQTKRALRWENN